MSCHLRGHRGQDRFPSGVTSCIGRSFSSARNSSTLPGLLVAINSLFIFVLSCSRIFSRSPMAAWFSHHRFLIFRGLLPMKGYLRVCPHYRAQQQHSLDTRGAWRVGWDCSLNLRLNSLGDSSSSRIRLGWDASSCGLKCRVAIRRSETVPWAYHLTNIATEDPIAHQGAQLGEISSFSSMVR